MQGGCGVIDEMVKSLQVVALKVLEAILGLG
jgi:hypothetical protein